jgi:hypothetical protein
VVIAASDQWGAAAQTVLELIGMMPASLLALGAFLVFPYFLPAAKVNFHEFAEQLPLALAVMRIPKAEAAGERHAKRMQGWEAERVTFRDLTRPSGARVRESLPLILQYVRNHAEEKGAEVARRVDLVENPQLGPRLTDPERQGGRERRQEIWRIGTAMESAALLLSRPRGRVAPGSTEAARRASEYLAASPGEDPLLAGQPAPQVEADPAPSGPTSASGGPVRASPLLPAWLRPPPDVALPATEPTGVPVSTTDDLSTRPVAARERPPTPSVSPPSSPTPPSADRGPEPALGSARGPPAAAAPPLAPMGTAFDSVLLDSRITQALKEYERNWSASVDGRLKEVADASERLALALRADFAHRVSELQGGAGLDPSLIRKEVDARFSAALDARFREIAEKIEGFGRTSFEALSERLRHELKQTTDEVAVRAIKAEDDLRAELAAQMDVQLLEVKEQGLTQGGEVEARVQQMVKERIAELGSQRTKETNELEQRLSLLVDGRTKDFLARVDAALARQFAAISASATDQVAQAERRIALERDARVQASVETQSKAVASLQTRMESYVEQMLRESRVEEQEKYVELLARLKADLERTIDRMLAAPKMEAVLKDAIARQVRAGRGLPREEVDRALAEAMEALRQERQQALESLDKTYRAEVQELDRRVAVVNDHVLPLVRQTWLKVAELDKSSGAKELEAAVKEIREQVRKVEGEMLERTATLGDKLAAAVSTHGRIWLTMIRQMSPEQEGGMPAAATPSSHRLARRAARWPVPPVGPPGPTDLAVEAPIYSEDPPNPMSPGPDIVREPHERPRRRSRKG